MLELPNQRLIFEFVQPDQGVNEFKVRMVDPRSKKILKQEISSLGIAANVFQKI